MTLSLWEDDGGTERGGTESGGEGMEVGVQVNPWMERE